MQLSNKEDARIPACSAALYLLIASFLDLHKANVKKRTSIKKILVLFQVETKRHFRLMGTC